MRAFYTASIIFVIIAILIIINAIFTLKFSNRMTSIIDELPKDTLDGADEILNKLEDYFSRREFLIMTTNNHNKVHDINKLFSQAKSAIISEDFALYTQTRLALYDAVNTLSEFNRISFIEIF